MCRMRRGGPFGFVAKKLAEAEAHATYCHAHGIYQWIHRHLWSERLKLCVIAVNAIRIGVDTGYNTQSILLESCPCISNWRACVLPGLAIHNLCAGIM